MRRETPTAAAERGRLCLSLAPPRPLGAGVAPAIALVAALGTIAATATTQSLPGPLSSAQVTEVRSSIDSMRRDVRGPYLRIRWFCADSTVHPPQGTPCAERGGGVQYAEYSPRALRLAALQVHVGTILQATPFDTLLDAEHAGYRLRELVVTRYLEDVDDGWALRRARYYRGARQIEDEEARGREVLERLLADSAWTSRNFLLAHGLVATIPHVGLAGEQRTYAIRNLATEIATLDSTFLNVRVKIHSLPSRDDIDAVERFRRARARDAAVEAKLTELSEALRAHYDERRSLEALAQYRRRVSGALSDQIHTLETAMRTGTPAEQLTQLAALSTELRRQVTRQRDGRRNLLLMDLNHAVQEQAFVLARDIAQGAGQAEVRRREEIAVLSDYVALAYGAGLLSGRERDALDTEIAAALDQAHPTALEYHQRLRYLARSTEWAAATVRAVYGPVYDRYTPFEPRAAGFSEAMLRASMLLPFSQALDRLLTDADALLGAAHVVFGQQVSHGLRGLNPGVAYRIMEIAESETAGTAVDATKIYVIPETTPELRPVAGVLTLGAGNLLSHVQLLARNLAIPNAAVSSELLPALEAAQGDTIFFAVSPLGRVVLERPSQLSADERQLIVQQRAVTRERYRLDVSRLRLDLTAPIPLAELRAEQSGVVVGPKAANLGHLASLFPRQVSKGVALPFGLFYRHVNRPFGSERTVLEELRDAYGVAARMRAAGQDEAEIDRFMFGALAEVRRAVLELDWLPEVRDAVVTAIDETFGEDVSRGVFVRSDTNVEDLPQFSGAGLNLTVAHQRTVDAILASVKRVWTSPFSERAYLWRKQILDDQAEIYPSVLLLESVPSEKSGVLISSGLQFGSSSDLTIATAEGVGGAVEGEATETIVVTSDGVVRLISQAKAPVRRVLADTGTGGAAIVAAQLPDTLLQPAEMRQLQNVVLRWKRQLPSDQASLTWDIEFGFVGGRLWLFQVRPFIRFRSSDLLDRLSILDRDVLQRGNRRISLEEES